MSASECSGSKTGFHCWHSEVVNFSTVGAEKKEQRIDKKCCWCDKTESVYRYWKLMSLEGCGPHYQELVEVNAQGVPVFQYGRFK